uniref:KRAB-related domain-containing protein n=1 Tax=Sciurus vulgaris TaxID=55149 RepID=A0A8D2DR53_SCIVU
MDQLDHISSLCKTPLHRRFVSEAFRDISKYFSKKEWAKLSHSEKITYVYLKRNYTTMTSLGLRATLPAFMSSNGQITESQSDDSDEYRNRGSQDESKNFATLKI